MIILQQDKYLMDAGRIIAGIVHLVTVRAQLCHTSSEVYILQIESTISVYC